MADLGSDFSCLFDSPPDMAEVTGRTCLIQAVARRIITPRGTLIDDPNYGFDLTQYVNDDIDGADLIRIQDGVRAECLKDERVSDAEVTLTFTAAGVLICKIILEDGDGPFTLVLSVSQASVDVLSVSK